MDKLNCSSLLSKRCSLSISGYSRKIRDNKPLIIALEKVISLYLYDSEMKLFKLFNPMKIYYQICQQKQYQITKCLKIKDWDNKIKLVLFPQSSLKFKLIIIFKMLELKYDVFYKTSSSTYTNHHGNCALLQSSDSKFRYPQNGEALQIKINFYKHPQKNGEHIMKVQIMDGDFRPLAAIKSTLKAKSIKNTSLYLQWKNKTTENDQDLGYKNGILLIETFKSKNPYENTFYEFSTRLDLWPDFIFAQDYDYDYTFKEHD